MASYPKLLFRVVFGCARQSWDVEKWELTRWRCSSRELKCFVSNPHFQLTVSRAVLTGGALGVLLDVLALLDELILGGAAGKTALRRSAELSGKARSAAGKLACSEHGD